MAIQMLQLEDHLLETVFKYCTLRELIELSSFCSRFDVIIEKKLEEKKKMTREDFHSLGFYSRVISSEMFRGKKLSSMVTLVKIESVIEFLKKLPNIEEFYLDVFLSLIPKHETQQAAAMLAGCCSNIVKFIGIEDGEQFILDYFIAVEGMKGLKKPEDDQPKNCNAIICQINPRDYFWDIHHESIKKLIDLRDDSIKLSISSKYINRENLDWIKPCMISRLNIDMSVDNLQIDPEILASISQLTFDWNWARDRPVTSVKVNQFSCMLSHAKKIDQLKAYEVPDCPQLLQQFSCLRSPNLKLVELHILNQGVNLSDREALSSFLSRNGNQLESFILRCDYIKDRSSHGMEHLFQQSIMKYCRNLKSLELSYYITYHDGMLVLEQYQNESLHELFILFSKTTMIEILFPTDEQVERWMEEFKWFCNQNRKKNYMLKFWRCSKYAISKQGFEETGTHWTISEIIPDLSYPDHFD